MVLRQDGLAQGTVRAQRYPAWELIVVEDASHGETARLVQQLAAESPAHRVVYLRHAVNRGQAAARNTAIAAARGEYIMVPAKLSGAPNGVVYMVDTRNGLLGGFIYDQNRRDLVPFEGAVGQGPQASLPERVGQLGFIRPGLSVRLEFSPSLQT